MRVYRITTAKWADKLSGSGYAARWNSKGKYVIYTAGSRALACLENLVHRSGEGLNNRFKVAEIEIPGNVSLEVLTPGQLKEDWNLHNNYTYCQRIGNRWLDQERSCVLKVPSSVIAEEHNVLINPAHPDFKAVHIHTVRDFMFDNRLKLKV